MDIQSEVENERFLIVCGGPYKGVCRLLTLKAGVVILAIADIVSGVAAFIIMAITLVQISVGNYFDFQALMFIFRLLIDVIAMPFAIIGLRGMNKISPGDISIYSKYKIIELFLIGLVGIIRIISESADEEIIIGITFLIIGRIIAAMIIKVIWSADIRLKYNETVLVMHGEDALKLMQQQAVNLADPKVITPGMPIYVASPYNESV
ncbi:hypothetical protein SteCoe_38315 [Stentor coeruleus]|uniref:Uncharacterized protein n=1 Tax=Stentor coeruleus TaxID=5963 RepID=A0A1R2ALL6_9CILI|nr:hypothetical protein SteCoe_38315 [Stentor coeruleus]